MKNVKIEPDSYITSIGTATRVVGQLPPDKSFDMDRKEAILKDYHDGKGYIDSEGETVWIYKDKKPLSPNSLPYVWVEDIDEDSWQFVCSQPSDEMKRIYGYSNIVSVSYDRINHTTRGDEQLYDEEAMLSIYSSKATFVPTVNDTDDGLKKLIKTYIIQTGVDIAGFQPKMSKNYALSNMKAALNGNTKMSMKYFTMWCELIGAKFEIKLTDKVGNIIEYNSTTDKCEAYKR